jgi:phage terminase small subunit
VPKKKHEYLRTIGRPRKTYDELLAHQHWQCVEYYMQGMSKTEAMLKAGYSETMAHKRQKSVFGRQDVMRAIEQRRWNMRSRNNKMIDRIKEELANIAFFNIGEVLEITEGGEVVFNFDQATMEQFSAIGEVRIDKYMEGKGRDAVEVKRVVVKPYDKKAALDSLARIYGMFNDNLTIHPGEGGTLEERLAAGRKRLNKPEDDVIEGEYTEVSRDTDDAENDDGEDEDDGEE